MDNSISNIVNEIAQQLDCNFRAYIHKETHNLLFVPNEDEFEMDNLRAWKEEFRELKSNYKEYFEIEKWSSKRAFQIMSDFAENLPDYSQLQKQLFQALNKKNPFREFRFIIDNSGNYREQWFAHKNNSQEAYVKGQLEDYFDIEE